MKFTSVKESGFAIVEAIYNNTLDDYDDHSLIEALTAADDLYFNDDESYVTDAEYDALRLYAQRRNPADVYFTGVGAAVRGGKIDLPFQMGSLDQIEIGDIERWVNKWNLKNETVILSDKMDGTSALLIYNKVGALQIAYSRGDGVQGADITRHISKIKNVPKDVGRSMNVRAEVELTETAFQALKAAGIKARSGKPYRNARNMVAGLMNAKTNPAIVYDYLTVIAYQIIGDEASKMMQFKHLETAGFQVADYVDAPGKVLTDKFLAKYIKSRKSDLDYAIDGVVIDVDDKDLRAKMNPTRDTLNPAYSIKYKVTDEENLAVAKVIGVEWAVSKHGYLKPRVNIEPVDLVGVTINFATGFNAKFIHDKGIGKGAEIEITRSGDVIPFIRRVTKSAVPEMPMQHDWDWEWNATGVDAVLKNHHLNDDVIINQNVAFFTSIDAPHLKTGSITKLYESGFRGPESIIRMDVREMVAVLGENGKKAHAGLRKALTDIPYYKLFGAYANERGIGVRKIKKLQQAVGEDFLKSGGLTVDAIASVPGFERTTAKKIALDWVRFQVFLEGIDGLYTIEAAKAVGTKLAGQKIVFSGFRDKDLQAKVEENGGEMQSSLSGKTTILVVKDPNGTSTKIKKARDLGTKIMSIDDFKGAV